MPTPVMLPEPFGYVPFPGEFYRPEQLSAEIKNDPFVTRVYSADQVRQAILEAEQRVSEGFVLVPAEPTPLMRRVFRNEYGCTHDFNKAYRAMLASRPTPTVKQSLTVAPEKASKT